MLALALICYQAVYGIPIWVAVCALPAVSVLCAVRFIHIRRHWPPSVERFHSLCEVGGVAAFCFAIMGVLGFRQLATDLGPGVRDRITIVLGMCLLTAGAAYMAWCYLAIQHYPGRRPRHPDFAEDEDGNPVRPTRHGP